MPFQLNFPAQNQAMSQLQLEVGQMLFVLGANGTGKSSLLQRFTQQNQNRTRKISAHRQTWMNSDTLDLTPSTKIQTETQIRTDDAQQNSRHRDRFASQRASMIIYELIDAENVRSRTMSAAYDAGNMAALEEAAKGEAPITIINELLRQSNLPIKITIRSNERVMASKDGGPEYSAAELSDGERNALLIAGHVLTAKPGTLLIIDEPERHLHRSITSPLLAELLQRRSDCGFIISTHDHDLPLEVDDARVLLLRSCIFNGQTVRSWEADELPANTQIDDILKRDLLGARRKILFVEGTEASLDKPLYSLIFPMVSVVPKGSCKDVEQAVVGSRAGEVFHWLRAFGIADGDGYDEDEIEVKRGRGVYALPYYSVEAIYFHPGILERVSHRQAGVSGDNANALFQNAMAAGVAAVAAHTDRLSRNVAKKSARKLLLDQLPNDDELLEGQEVSITNDAPAIHLQRKAELDNAVQIGNWEAILVRCPVRQSSALADISSSLGFQSVEQYEKAVRHLLTEDDAALAFARGLFGNLFDQLNG